MEPTVKSFKHRIKRDLSMPPVRVKYVSDVDQNLHPTDFTEIKQNNDVYDDSILTIASNTPPPVQIISTTSASEYINQKPIIRPLAFRPVQIENRKNNDDLKQSNKIVLNKTKNFCQRKISPSDVSLQNSQISTKSTLYKVPSAKSGDSSGYYSRPYESLIGTASSTEISQTFDESISIYNNFPKDGSYDSAESTSNYDVQNFDLKHDHYLAKCSFAPETMSERLREKLLEASVANSNCRLLKVEGKIVELKKRLCQKCNEFNRVVKNLESLNRQLELQNKKYLYLQSTMQSLKTMANEKNRFIQFAHQSSQTVSLNTNDVSITKLLEQFEKERKIWLSEKYKVLSYQKQIENNYQQLFLRSRRLEYYIFKVKSEIQNGQIKGSVNHSNDQARSSSNSIDSSKINRIEGAEHKSSF